MNPPVNEERPDARIEACPFCGGAAAFGVCPDSDAVNAGGWFISCPDCRACSKLIFPYKEDPKPLLLEAWNARLSLAHLRERVSDAELLIGWFLARHSGWDPPYSSESKQLECHDGRDGGSFFVVPVDERGLPSLPLSPEVRAAAKKADMMISTAYLCGPPPPATEKPDG